MPSTFYSYERINPTVLALFNSDTSAEYCIEAWLKSRNFFNASFFSVLDKKYVSAKYVVEWLGISRPSLYNAVKNNREFLESLGLTYAVSTNDERLKTADELNLKNYANLTTYITLFSPRAVLCLLLCSRSEEAKNFRKYIKDWSPKKAYCASKLLLYFQQDANETKA